MAIDKPLVVYSNFNLRGYGNYYVVTPEGDRMDFDTKPKARAFIEFYKQYKEKSNGNKHVQRKSYNAVI
jgi:hypothetical protein